MDATLHEKAQRRLATALEETGAFDPRDLYRELLRRLRSQSQEGYEELVDRFEKEVVEAVGREGRDPLEAWLGFGLALARRLHPGRTVVVDESGRSRPFAPPPDWRSLILHLPDESRERAIPVGRPPELSPSQQAALDLLTAGKVKLPTA